jgi:hypothetical protein
MQIEQSRNVVDLNRIWHGDHRALFHPHRIGLIVVYPIADIFDAVLGKDIERAHGLAERRAKPAARRLADAFADGGDDVLDQRTLLRFRLAGEQGRVVVAVAHPLPAELLAFLDDARITRAHVGVQRDRAFDAVALHHFHHPPDADAHAIVPPGIVEHVGVDRQIGEPGRRPVEQKVLDIGDHPNRDAGAVGP